VEFSYGNPSGTVIVTSNGALVPIDPDNPDYQAILASGATIAPYAPPVPETLTRWQFFTAAALGGVITQDQAKGALTGTMPQPFVDFIATLPADQQFAATMLLTGTQEFHRHHVFVQAFLQAKGMTDAQADAIWTQGAALLAQ